jgi:hypothetical protein
LVEISKIPNCRIVFTSDNSKGGNIETFERNFIFVTTSFANSKTKRCGLPRTTIVRIKENEMKLEISRKEINKYILKAEDPGTTLGP